MHEDGEDRRQPIATIFSCLERPRQTPINRRSDSPITDPELSSPAQVISLASAIMSTADLPAAPASLATTSEAKKKKKSRSEKRAAAAKANPHERIKTVVRRLPPNLPEEIFWQSVQKWVSDETVVWKSYMQGKLRKK